MDPSDPPRLSCLQFKQKSTESHWKRLRQRLMNVADTILSLQSYVAEVF
jgi:hypothetical protein